MITARLEKNDTIVFNGMCFQADEGGTFEITFDTHSGKIFASLIQKVPAPGRFFPVNQTPVPNYHEKWTEL